MLFEQTCQKIQLTVVLISEGGWGYVGGFVVWSHVTSVPAIPRTWTLSSAWNERCYFLQFCI